MVVLARRFTELSWFDYFLSAAASCLAAYAAGYGLGVPAVAFFFVTCIVVGTVVGALLQRVAPRRLARADGIFYAATAILAMVYVGPLNDLLPSGGFPFELRIAGWLCWMLVFGSFFMWRDSTMLFQAVPGIALFGLVGTWDTFRPSPFLFFVFLLCFATLFSRAHSRSMMMRAQSSGFTSNALDARTPEGFTRALRRGPWRWMAGPEWALMSALVVVLISLIGAPFLQFSLKGVSGKVHLPPPPTPAMRANYFGSGGFNVSTNFQSSTFTEVGSGPHGDLDQSEVFDVTYPGHPYMLAHTAWRFTGRGWIEDQNEIGRTSQASTDLFNLNTHSATRSKDVPFSVLYKNGSYDSVPVPTDLDALSGVDPTTFRTDGTVVNTNLFGQSTSPLSGDAFVPLTRPVEALKDSPDLAKYIDRDGHNSTARVQQLALSLVQGKKTDHEKAEAIRSYIASHCTYDLKAKSAPYNSDRVDYFLFSSRRGYCDLFASAMTVMAQSAGLPSRFVIGWAPFTKPHQNILGWQAYFATDYHCWCQVFFKDVGWVTFDATDGAAQAPGAGLGSGLNSTPWYLAGSVIFGAGALAMIGVAWFALWLARKLRLRLPQFGVRKAELERAYAELVRTVEYRTGKPRRPSQTALEYLETVTPYLDGSFEAVKAATDKFVSAYYGAAEPTAKDIEAVKILVRDARQTLKQVRPLKESLRNEIG